MTKNKKTTILALVVLVVLIAAALLAWKLTRAQPQQGSKAVTLTIQQADGSTKATTLHTDQEYLLNAMQEVEGLVGGYESEFGYTITDVQGLNADPDAGQWWVFTKGGEWVDTDVSHTPIYDGDAFEFSIYVY